MFLSPQINNFYYIQLEQTSLFNQYHPLQPKILATNNICAIPGPSIPWTQTAVCTCRMMTVPPPSSSGKLNAHSMNISSEP